MQIREKILASALAVTLGGGIMLPRAWNAYQEPLTQRSVQISQLEKRLDTLRDEQLLDKAKLRKMEMWKRQSLPANPQTAMMFYQQWLTDLAEAVARFQKVTVAPEPFAPSKDGSYVGVRVKVTGKATVDQVRSFLYAFYRADLLQHIVKMTLENPRREMPPVLTVTITTEGLSVKDAPDRGASLFARTTMTGPVAEGDTTITVENAAAFPPKAPFDIRIDGEFLKVVETAGTRWTVERGVAQFPKSSHAAGATVEFAPVNALTKDRTLADYDVLVAQNPFAKPVKTAVVATSNQPPVIQPVETVTVAPGQTAAFQVVASDPETPKDRLYFSLDTNAPQGAMIDPETGQFAWVPDASVPPGDYRIVVKVADDASEPKTTTLEVTVKVTEDVAQFVYLTYAGAADSERRAWLYDRSTNKRMVLAEGATLQYAGIRGSVDEIGRDYVLLNIDGAQRKLGLGNNLRSLVRPAASPPPASQPPQPADASKPPSEKPVAPPQQAEPSPPQTPPSETSPPKPQPSTESPQQTPNPESPPAKSPPSEPPAAQPAPAQPPAPESPPPGPAPPKT